MHTTAAAPHAPRVSVDRWPSEAHETLDAPATVEMSSAGGDAEGAP